MGIHQGLSGFAGIFLAALVAQSLSLISTGYTNFFSRVWSAWQMVSQLLCIWTLSVIILNMPIPIWPEKKCLHFLHFSCQHESHKDAGSNFELSKFPKKSVPFYPILHYMHIVTYRKQDQRNLWSHARCKNLKIQSEEKLARICQVNAGPYSDSQSDFWSIWVHSGPKIIEKDLFQKLIGLG